MATTTTLTGSKSDMDTAHQPKRIPETLRWRALPAPLMEDSPSSFPILKTPGIPVPCRRCQQDSQVGEEMLLLSYDPFLGDSPYRGASPIFIHAKANPCKLAVFPASGGYVPEQQRKRVISVRAYDGEHMLQGCEVVDGEQLPEVCERLLGDDSSAEYCHVHFAQPGCFVARVEKASSPS